MLAPTLQTTDFRNDNVYVCVVLHVCEHDAGLRCVFSVYFLLLLLTVLLRVFIFVPS